MARYFHPGMLRHQVSVQTITRTATATGGFTESWATAATRKAAIDSPQGNKFYRAQQAETENGHTVVMRFYDGLTTKDHRLLFGTRALNITHIQTVDEIEHWMVLMCKEDAA